MTKIAMHSLNGREGGREEGRGEGGREGGRGEGGREGGRGEGGRERGGREGGRVLTCRLLYSLKLKNKFRTTIALQTEHYDKVHASTY